MIRKWLSILVLGLTMVGVGCDQRSTAPKPVDRVTVVATVYPLADVARQVGGGYVEPSWVLESSQSLRGFEPGPETRSRLRSVDLVLMGGVAEQWAGEGFGDPSQGRRIIRLDILNLPDTVATKEGYVWLDPRLVIEASRELCARLQVLRPTHEQQFKANTDEFVNKLDELTREYQSKLAGAHAKKVLVLGTDFEPLLTRFGFVPIATVQTSPMQIDDAQLRTITQIARENNTRLLVVPADTPTLNMRDLEVRAGLQLISIDGLGNSGATGRNTYLQILRYDLEQLLAATTVQ